jgi:nucleoside-diphosphate-sugar epimerase
MTESIKILVTGCAGFIGWKVCEFLLTRPHMIPMTQSPSDSMTINVYGIDNLNKYYDVRLKRWRLEQLVRLSSASKSSEFIFHKIDIEDKNELKQLIIHASGSNRPCAGTSKSRSSSPPFDAIINLAARAGVRYSIENPFVYYTTNVIGNLNLLELCRQFNIKKYILASTSSLYAGQRMPFQEELSVNEPISPYAASKKSAEVTCYTYHKLFKQDITILRYFTVYGPAGRPDMSIFRFISWVDQKKPVIIYGDGNQTRDFTYVDDIAQGTIAALKPIGFEVINLGSDAPHKLIDVLHTIEDILHKKAKINYQPFHPADMVATWADITKARHLLNWQPHTRIEQGIEAAVDWYLDNHSWASRIKL